MGECCEHGKKKGSSFLGRWTKRLLLLSFLGALGLSAGFYMKKDAEGKPQKKLPWQDPQAFETYAVDVFTFAKEKGTKYAERAKEKWDTEWSKDAESLWERAQKVVAGDGSASESGAASEAEKKADATPTATRTPPRPARSPDDPVAGPGGPAQPGYYDAYKAGCKAYKEGCEHFVKAKPGLAKDRAAELKAALASFDVAQAQWEKAQSLRENDPHLDELMQKLMQFRKETRTQLERSARSY